MELGRALSSKRSSGVGAELVPCECCPWPPHAQACLLWCCMHVLASAQLLASWRGQLASYYSGADNTCVCAQLG